MVDLVDLVDLAHWNYMIDLVDLADLVDLGDLVDLVDLVLLTFRTWHSGSSRPCVVDCTRSSALPNRPNLTHPDLPKFTLPAHPRPPKTRLFPPNDMIDLLDLVDFSDLVDLADLGDLIHWVALPDLFPFD